MEMPEANEYINDPEYMECVSDILDHPVFQSMDQYIQHGTTTCKCHCIQVSYLAYTWCKRFGGNWRSAARAVSYTHLDVYKRQGYEPAEKNPAAFHGVSPFDIKTGRPVAEKKYPTYTDVFSKKLCQLGETHPELVAVTAAMPDGTGVAAFGKRFPDRFFDVGIAEAHAVTSAAGMAAAGLRPVVAVYSSFLQRGYDQILHDVCIQNLPVIFAVDRA